MWPENCGLQNGTTYRHHFILTLPKKHLCLKDDGVWCLHNCFRKWLTSSEKDVAIPHTIATLKSVRKAAWNKTPLEDLTTSQCSSDVTVLLLEMAAR